MPENDIDKNLERELQQLLADQATPVLTAEDFRFRVVHYIAPLEGVPGRLVATYGKAGRYFESDTLLKVERLAETPDTQLSEAHRTVLDALLPNLVTDTVPSSIENTALLKVTEALADVQPVAWLQGFFYREAVYLVSGYLVSVFYPAIGREAKKRPITAFVRTATEPLRHLVGTALPPVVDSAEVSVSSNRIVVNWSADYIGWGQFYFWDGEDGLIHCDNENMDRDFIKAVLNRVVDDFAENKTNVSPAAVAATLAKVLPGAGIALGQSAPSSELKKFLDLAVDRMVLEDG